MQHQQIMASLEETRPPTLKQRALEIAEAELEDNAVHPNNADALSLSELKIETDSRMALVVFLLGKVGCTPATTQLLAEHLQTKKDNNSTETPLQVFEKEGEEFFLKVFLYLFDRLKDSGRIDLLWDGLDYYRQAYFDRSPRIKSVDTHYGDSRALLATGLRTPTETFSVLANGINTAAVQRGVTYDEAFNVTLASDHLATTLAKMKLSHLEFFVRLINEHPEGEHAMVELIPVASVGKYTTRFTPGLFRKMRTLYEEDSNRHGHRRKEGCPAAVLFPGYEAVVSDLWRLCISALNMAGQWHSGEERYRQMSPLDILGRFVSSPNAEERANGTKQDAPGTEPVAVIHSGT